MRRAAAARRRPQLLDLPDLCRRPRPGAAGAESTRSCLVGAVVRVKMAPDGYVVTHVSATDVDAAGVLHFEVTHPQMHGRHFGLNHISKQLPSDQEIRSWQQGQGGCIHRGAAAAALLAGGLVGRQQTTQRVRNYLADEHQLERELAWLDAVHRHDYW